MAADEILRMDRSEVIVFIDNKIVFGRKITYAEVWPWSEWAGDNPLEGSKLPGKVRLEIENLNDGESTMKSRLKSLFEFAN